MFQISEFLYIPIYFMYDQMSIKNLRIEHANKENVLNSL